VLPEDEAALDAELAVHAYRLEVDVVVVEEEPLEEELDPP
jgi:hypothetical protein